MFKYVEWITKKIFERETNPSERSKVRSIGLNNRRRQLSLININSKIY